MKTFSKKCANRELFLQELRNSIDAYNISKKTAVFATPAVIGYSETEHVIHFEFLENAISVLKILRSYDYLKIQRDHLIKLFFNIGFALAEYHAYSGKLHGDCFLGNVMVKPGNDRKIYFIDFASPIEIKDPHYDHGSVLKDLALFAIGIRLKYPIYLFPLAFRGFNEQLCQEFFRGYIQRSQVTFDNQDFAQEIENTKLLPTLRNTFVITFLNWIPCLKITGYKNEI